MEKAKFKDLDISSLEKFKYQGGSSTLFQDGDMLIKVLDRFSDAEKKELLKKALKMDGVSLKQVLLPKTLYTTDGKLEAYSIDNYLDSKTLFDFYNDCSYIHCQSLFAPVRDASFILRDIHKNGFCCNDVSFDNILINNKGEVKYTDFFDNCTFGSFSSYHMSRYFFRFMFFYRREHIGPGCSNSDKITFLLNFYELLYQKGIHNISQKQYQALEESSLTLQNAKKYVDLLLDKSKMLPEIPYMDELIDNYDDFIIDRSRQCPLFTKTISKYKK